MQHYLWGYFKSIQEWNVPNPHHLDIITSGYLDHFHQTSLISLFCLIKRLWNTWKTITINCETKIWNDNSQGTVTSVPVHDESPKASRVWHHIESPGTPEKYVKWNSTVDIPKASHNVIECSQLNSTAHSMANKWCHQKLLVCGSNLSVHWRSFSKTFEALGSFAKLFPFARQLLHVNSFNYSLLPLTSPLLI